jgi:hypothetical protein
VSALLSGFVFVIDSDIFASSGMSAKHLLVVYFVPAAF